MPLSNAALAQRHIPLSLYIHIPWCLKKCPYCDFNSHQHKTPINSEFENHYIDALITDLAESVKRLEKNRQSFAVHTIFIGGGTPNLFSPKSIGILLNKVNNILSIPNNCEITMEANPGAYEEKKFHDFKNIGINRLSIGVQSFDNDCLKSLGRVHDRAQAMSAITTAKNLNFNLNLDLMHGLPGQNLDGALNDIKTAIDFEPNHLSWYQLTLEPNTEFAKKPPILPNENILDDIYCDGMDYLVKNGYYQYEISAFAKDPRYQSKHNLNYWRFGDYIGIGAGAHSKLTKSFEVTRIWKQKSPTRYLNNSMYKISGESKLTTKEIILEYMMNKLRLLEPILETDFTYYTNLKFSDINQQILKTAENNNWLIVKNNCLQTTPLGLKFLNNLILLFV